MQEEEEDEKEGEPSLFNEMRITGWEVSLLLFSPPHTAWKFANRESSLGIMLISSILRRSPFETKASTFVK